MKEKILISKNMIKHIDKEGNEHIYYDIEEKQAIEILKELKEEVQYCTIIQNEKREEWKREYNAIETILKLIEKQQKEIEQLKEKCEEHIYIEANKQIQQLYISKDKIREKMELLELRKAFSEEFTEEFYLSQIELLQELLEGEEE